ncbi:MAG TPA: class I SAM-dependent methyltransferase [Casimicrobiaceae bacterium]|nr:class I SAM-dependent methyltransferase [Casimicrobiaceae bacterium]
MSSELHRLEKIAGDSLYAAGVNSDTIRYSFRIFERHLRGASILEMGPAEGVMTELLAGTGKSLTVVEGSLAFCDSIAARLPAVDVVHSLFEDYAPSGRFDNIVLGHVLEHVEDAAAIVARAAQWLMPRGRILAAVPNSRSLHRQAAVLMQLLPGEDALNEMDIHHGHRRVFSPESFRRCFLDAGLTIDIFGGYWLKPVSNRQIEQTWTPAMLDAFMQLGERYPDIAGEIYVVASPRAG